MRRSLRAHLARALIAPLVIGAVALCALALRTQIEVRQLAETPPSPSRVDVLMERHDCWRGDQAQPADVWLPGHVVISPPGTTRAVYRGRNATTLALTQEFGGVDRGIVVHGFCR
jgi:hypothetical protein